MKISQKGTRIYSKDVLDKESTMHEHLLSFSYFQYDVTILQIKLHWKESLTHSITASDIFGDTSQT